MSHEILCAVDKNDRPIGTASRKEIHSSKMWHRGVHVFLYDKKGNMIVQRRGPKKDKYPNKLDCAVSEHSLSDEDCETAAKRGLKEELGISPRIKLLVHFRMVYGPKDYMVCKLFECKHKGKIRPNEEVNGVFYIQPAELMEMIRKDPSSMTPWFREMLKWKYGIKSKLQVIGAFSGTV